MVFQGRSWPGDGSDLLSECRSGKTSLIHALSGELGLDIYVVSLSAKGMNDTMLMNLMGRIPQR